MTFLYRRITLKSRYLETNFEKLENLSKFYVFRVFLEIIKNGFSHVLALTPSINISEILAVVSGGTKK